MFVPFVRTPVRLLGLKTGANQQLAAKLLNRF
jgi:hypothetical protein